MKINNYAGLLRVNRRCRCKQHQRRGRDHTEAHAKHAPLLFITLMKYILASVCAILLALAAALDSHAQAPESVWLAAGADDKAPPEYQARPLPERLRLLHRFGIRGKSRRRRLR